MIAESTRQETLKLDFALFESYQQCTCSQYKSCISLKEVWIFTAQPTLRSSLEVDHINIFHVT